MVASSTMERRGGGQNHQKKMFVNPISLRKERRKEKRLLKKSKRHAFCLGNEMPTVSQHEVEKRATAVAEKKRVKRKKKKVKLIQKKIENRKQKQKDARDKKEEEHSQKLAIVKEDQEIKELEKKLNMKKSRKSLPQSFVADGLDFLFEPLGSHKEGPEGMDEESSSTETDEETQFDSESEDFDEDDLSRESDADDSSSGDEDVPDIELSSESGLKLKSILKDKSSRNIPDKYKTIKWTEGILNASSKSDDIDDSDDSDDSTGNNSKQKRKHDSASVSEKDGSIMSEKKTKLKRLKTTTVEKDVEKDNTVSSRKRKTSESSKKVSIGKDVCPELSAKTKKRTNKRKKDVVRKDKRNSVDSDESAGDDVNEDSNNTDSSDDVNEDNNDLSEEGEERVREDIYGRTIDQHGNVIEADTTSAYVPPGKRALMSGKSGKRKIALERLTKQLKGLINRASEANMQPISTQIEEIFTSNSRADINELLTKLLLDACATHTVTPERLCQELMMLVAILHGNVGMEVGAFFLQSLAQRFEAVFSSSKSSPSKEMDNVVLLLASLYNFKIVGSSLLFDVAARFVTRMSEKDVELILLLLKSAGFSLRKEDPSGLKALIVDVQAAAVTMDTAGFQDNARVRFMLETLLAIKNNNMRKIPNYDPEHLEHLRKLIRNYVRGGGFGSNQLNIGLEDLLKAEARGRWWVVGSAWGGRGQVQEVKDSTPLPNIINKASSQLMELARKQRMNTDIRKTIFFVIMTSEDYIDSFEKLMKLGLKHQQEREIIHVILDCCLQEKNYNPFYSFIALKFCEFDRRFQMTVQFSLWDKFKEMGSLSQQNRENLSSLVAHLLIKKGMSLSVLKVVEFGSLEKPMVRFLKSLLVSVLMADDQKEMEAVFERIAPLDKLRHLQEGLKLFLHHFLLRGKRKLDMDSEASDLCSRMRLAEKALSLGQHSLLL